MFLTSVTHDEAINILRNAGSEVNLTVKHYKSAAPFLLKQVRQFIPDVDAGKTRINFVFTKEKFGCALILQVFEVPALFSAQSTFYFEKQ